MWDDCGDAHVGERAAAEPDWALPTVHFHGEPAPRAGNPGFARGSKPVNTAARAIEWPIRLPKGYDVLPWAQVTTAEREALRVSNLEKPWIAPDLVPFYFEENYEPVTSVALRINGATLGWCLNHVVDGILRFTCSFLRRDLQRLGRIVLLYSESVSRMPVAGLSVGMWTVPIKHAGMVNFTRKHMQPYSIFFGETRGVTAHLDAAVGIAGQ